ncbi:hypothetical protein IUY40_08215 [Flavobacterium sp. ALJ2]|uniref:hypothetical protein n=1 Tax=Flavobacterium sp. ALJ2 TaxID=2786960 RepID=UPI00189E8F12|nr:hypothetical protein [Flavobacterium sp. ALJ2]MBF7091522.1 hypothetical protein [Flavobacterium sp. ALJ2]
MSTNTLSEEAKTRLMNFFSHVIEPKDMAKVIRQANYLLTMSAIKENQDLQNEIINFEDSFYWLNELAEALNPYLSVK